MKPIKPYKNIYKHQEKKEKKEEDLRESRALGPNAAVVADDGCGGEVIAFDFAHEMIIDVGLPRHLPLLLLLLCTSEIVFLIPVALEIFYVVVVCEFVFKFRWVLLSAEESTK